MWAGRTKGKERFSWQCPGLGGVWAHLWHGTDFVHLADELTVGLKKQQQLEV